MKTLLKNVSTVVTCNDQDEVLHGVDVLMDGAAIAGIGRFDAQADEVIDASKLALYPGLVNTHHHL